MYGPNYFGQYIFEILCIIRLLFVVIILARKIHQVFSALVWNILRF